MKPYRLNLSSSLSAYSRDPLQHATSPFRFSASEASRKAAQPSLSPILKSEMKVTLSARFVGRRVNCLRGHVLQLFLLGQRQHVLSLRSNVN